MSYPSGFVGVTAFVLLSFCSFAIYDATTKKMTFENSVRDIQRKDTMKLISKVNRIVKSNGLSDEVVLATYYGEDFHGKVTSNGEIFDMNALTAAHRTLPFGTKVRIVNVSNGKQVVVKINDRGPFIKGRTFDLSKEAFKAIASLKKGVIRVRYQILSDAETTDEISGR